MHIYSFICCSLRDPLTIELFDTVAPINATLNDLAKKQPQVYRPMCQSQVLSCVYTGKVASVRNVLPALPPPEQPLRHYLSVGAAMFVK